MTPSAGTHGGPIERLITSRGIEPVLVDIGASIAPPAIWNPIAPLSTYVGFDPDPREMRDSGLARYRRAEIVPKAVTADATDDSVRFYLTRSATCSSTLEPDARALSDFVFADRFVVEREASASAITLDRALSGLGLPAAHWVKADTQGLDVRLFESMSPELRASVLALDVEPGLIDAYAGEDLFVDGHRRLTAAGFWLSRLDVHGTGRVRRDSLERLAARDSHWTSERAERALRETPAWVNARYLRTLGSLAESRRSDDYALEWAFASLDDQPGFCLDLAFAYEARFGADATSALMRDEAVRELSRFRWRGFRHVAGAVSPAWLKRLLRGARD